MLNQQRLAALSAAAFGYVVKFMAYSIFTAAVLMTFAALMTAYIILVGPEMPFLQYLSFVLPIDARGNASIDGDDIMRVYGLLAMALFVLSVTGGWLMRVLKRAAKQIFQSEPEVESESGNIPASRNLLSSSKRRLIVSSVVITTIYLVLFLVIPSADMAEGTSFLTMYAVFAVFYVIALATNAIYIGIDGLSDMVLGWAWSRVLGV